MKVIKKLRGGEDRKRNRNSYEDDQRNVEMKKV